MDLSETIIPSDDERQVAHRSDQLGKLRTMPEKVAVRNPIYILRMPVLHSRLGMARATIYDWMNPDSPRYDPTFPLPIKLSAGGSVGWIEEEVDEWLASKASSSRK